MATKDLFDLDATLGSEEEDEDFDEEMGEPRPKKSNGANGIEDSSEEEDDDDDERLAEASYLDDLQACWLADCHTGRRRLHRR